MKERPILFSGPMVRAILDGRKTQTRRIGKCQNDCATELAVEYHPHATKGEQAVATYRAYPDGGSARHGLCTCPYGVPGDRLWVRETWMEDHAAPSRRAFYRASWGNTPDGQRWRPSIHMPRWASRITLEITGVRVERLQDIADQDALAEGVRPRCISSAVTFSPRVEFAHLWESINGTESWYANPWVWVVEFKRVEAERIDPRNADGDARRETHPNQTGG